mmetsp:Transcript_34869/g.107931  ORF Transcript_34869/g.107931 Transcript_34869/m.107931 type:complete len:273 (+) Transcript_34869:89-907(+)
MRARNDHARARPHTPRCRDDAKLRPFSTRRRTDYVRRRPQGPPQGAGEPAGAGRVGGARRQLLAWRRGRVGHHRDAIRRRPLENRRGVPARPLLAPQLAAAAQSADKAGRRGVRRQEGRVRRLLSRRRRDARCRGRRRRQGVPALHREGRRRRRRRPHRIHRVPRRRRAGLGRGDARRRVGRGGRGAPGAAHRRRAAERDDPVAARRRGRRGEGAARGKGRRGDGLHYNWGGAARRRLRRALGRGQVRRVAAGARRAHGDVRSRGPVRGARG